MTYHCCSLDHSLFGLVVFLCLPELLIGALQVKHAYAIYTKAQKYLTKAQLSSEKKTNNGYTTDQNSPVFELFYLIT